MVGRSGRLPEFALEAPFPAVVSTPLVCPGFPADAYRKHGPAGRDDAGDITTPPGRARSSKAALKTAAEVESQRRPQAIAGRLRTWRAGRIRRCAHGRAILPRRAGRRGRGRGRRGTRRRARGPPGGRRPHGLSRVRPRTMTTSPCSSRIRASEGSSEARATGFPLLDYPSRPRDAPAACAFSAGRP
jgi:hypothetical protein